MVQQPKLRMVFFIIACLCAGLAPVMDIRFGGPAKGPPFPGWPEQFNGRQLIPLTLSKKEKQFTATFPGRMARFQAGNHALVIRWVIRPTRKLHSAADCYRGSGFHLKYLPLVTDKAGNRWATFEARKAPQIYVVKERIVDAEGRQWTDVSSWYWAALLGKTTGPWWAFTASEAVTQKR